VVNDEQEILQTVKVPGAGPVGERPCTAKAGLPLHAVQPAGTRLWPFRPPLMNSAAHVKESFPGDQMETRYWS